MRFTNNKVTICEVLRQINDRLQSDSYINTGEIRDMLALAEQMAKRIVEKLREYNEKDDPESWAENKEAKDLFNRQMKYYIIGDANKALKNLIGKSK